MAASEGGGVRLLIENGLMFGGLILVNSAAWVARYNRALEKLTGRTTALTEFHIDLAGVSPEIGDELGRMDYLAAEGGVRQFILLTTEQKTAPLLNAELSVQQGILRRFIAANEAQLFTLTARDAVVGSMDDEVFETGKPADLMAVRRLRVSADTPGSFVAESGKLTALIERFRAEPDAWWDDVLIAEMIAQAKKSGDVTRNPVAFAQTEFEVGDYHTTAFGGVYVFRSPKEPALVFSDPAQKADVPGARSLTLEDRLPLAAWMARNALAEPIASARSPEVAGLLRQKIDFILVDAATRLGIDTGAGTRAELRRAAARMGAGLPPAVRGLAQLLAYVEEGGDWPVIDSASPAYFHAIRATPGPARDVVNMMLAELAPQDVRALFILNKPLFYKLYRGWSPAKQAYVVARLAQEYQADKDGTREALFGPEPGMAEPAPIPGPWGAALRPATGAPRSAGPTVGPWGAVLGQLAAAARRDDDDDDDDDDDGGRRRGGRGRRVGDAGRRRR